MMKLGTIIKKPAVVRKQRFLFFKKIIVVSGVHWHIYKVSYNVSNISYLNSPPPLLSFISPPLIPETVSTDVVFAFTYMYTHYLHHVHPPTLFPAPSPPPATPPGRTCSALLFSDFCRRKNIKYKRNMAFLLV
jgi:hypothetical protein